MVIDSHTHIFPEHVVDRAMEALGARYGARPVGRPTPDGLLRHMDECGVDRAVVLAVATRPDQVESITSWFTGLLAEGRFIPFPSLHPHSTDLEGDVRRVVEAGLRGVKLQPHFQGFSLSDPQFLRMLELIGDRLVVLMHGGQEIVNIDDVQPTPARLIALHERFPAVRFVCAHLGAFRYWDEVEQCMVGRSVTLDASYVFGICPDERIARIIRAHGADRVVWGSDFPWQTQAEGLAGIARLGLSENETRQILGGSLRGLLGG